MVVSILVQNLKSLALIPVGHKHMNNTWAKTAVDSNVWSICASLAAVVLSKTNSFQIGLSAVALAFVGFFFAVRGWRTSSRILAVVSCGLAIINLLQLATILLYLLLS